jgi:hypothetical protein
VLLLIDLGAARNRLGGSASRRSTAAPAPSRRTSTIPRAWRVSSRPIQAG